MALVEDLAKAYHWNYRPQTPKRPEWFTEWPGGAKIAVAFNIMHEWESRPTPHHTVPSRPLPPDTHYRDDFFALTMREYGANFGFWRLLDVFDKYDVKASVLSSGLTATLFPETVAEAVRRGMKLALRRSPAMVGYWDADLATPLEAVLQFRSVLEQRPELVLVMGSRVALLGRRIRRRWIRHVLGRAFATAASLTLDLVVYDTQCGAKLFRVTPETASLFDRPFHTRWIFDVEILARMIAATRAGGGLPAEETLYEFPLDRWEDVAGSRLTSRDFLIAALDLAAIRWRYLRAPQSRIPNPNTGHAAETVRRDAA